MRIAIIGYGRMGHEVEQAARERGHSIAATIDSSNAGEINSLDCDAAIEFTHPESAIENLKTLIDQGIPVACGTTGWNDRYEEVADYCRQKNGALLHASNFSLGVNIFFAINRVLTRLAGSSGSYGAYIEETHHIHKLDAPSGTAITLADDIISGSRYRKWEKEEAEGKDILPVKSKRIDEVPGIHKVQWDSEVDTITIEHSAKSRKGFALGAVLAAEFLDGKHGVYSMKDLLNITE